MDFRNELTGKAFDDKIEFRNSVIKLLREIFPKLKVRVETDAPPEVVFINEMQCGLTNLHSRYARSARTAHELKEIVADHFGGIVAALEQVETNFEKTWDAAQTLVFPQLMPRDYAAKFGAVSRAFGKDVLIGVVVDDERSYRYVRTAELETWNITKPELYDTAIENLAAKSSGIEMNLIPPPNGFLAISTGDGFDAARIVLPQLQNLIREHFGSPFRFGVPNRDFLICWNKDEPAEFQAAISGNLAKDSETRPYPLCGTPFEIDDFGEISQVENGKW